MPPPEVPAVPGKFLRIREGFLLLGGVMGFSRFRRALQLYVYRRIRGRVPSYNGCSLCMLQGFDLQGLLLDFIQELLGRLGVFQGRDFHQLFLDFIQDLLQDIIFKALPALRGSSHMVVCYSWLFFDAVALQFAN